jgi:hypothetical protein
LDLNGDGVLDSCVATLVMLDGGDSDLSAESELLSLRLLDSNGQLTTNLLAQPLVLNRGQGKQAQLASQLLLPTGLYIGAVMEVGSQRTIQTGDGAFAARESYALYGETVEVSFESPVLLTPFQTHRLVLSMDWLGELDLVSAKVLGLSPVRMQHVFGDSQIALQAVRGEVTQIHADGLMTVRLHQTSSDASTLAVVVVRPPQGQALQPLVGDLVQVHGALDGDAILCASRLKVEQALALSTSELHGVLVYELSPGVYSVLDHKGVVWNVYADRATNVLDTHGAFLTKAHLTPGVNLRIVLSAAAGTPIANDLEVSK